MTTYLLPETIRAGDAEIALSSIQLSGDRLLIRGLTHDEMGMRSRLLHLPDQIQDHQQILQGVVVACGPLVSANLLPGFRVVCSRFQRVPVDNEGKFWVTTEDACIAVIQV